MLPDLTAGGIVATLDRFSQATGGKAYFLKQPQELSATLREIRRELSHQYIIGYTSYVNGGDEYRRITGRHAPQKIQSEDPSGLLK